MFTRRFYEALLDGSDPAFAAAQGRVAALSEQGVDPKASADWTLPTVFVSGHPLWKQFQIPPGPADHWPAAAADYAPPRKPPKASAGAAERAFTEPCARPAHVWHPGKRQSCGGPDG